MEFAEIIDLISQARQVLTNNIHRTPLVYSTYLSELVGKNVYVKLENLQKTGSFKVRGAFFKIHTLLPEARERGVVAASSGNHAQGVAYSASRLEVPAIIVMPETAPPYKVNATRSYGAEVILHGKVYDDAYMEAVKISKEKGAFFIHPFDDPYVIAGQGTMGMEIVEDLPNVDTILVPVGGGGLISGIALGARSVRGGNYPRIIAVEPTTAPKLVEALKVGRPVKIEPGPSLADGVITKSIGRLTYEIIRSYVDEALTVEEDWIARAIFMLLERMKLLSEGAGALPVAALLKYGKNLPGDNVVAVISGGNADLTTLYRVILRGLMGEGRIFRVALLLRDVPGALESVLEAIAEKRCNILEIQHERFDPTIKPGYAKVVILMEAPSKEVAEEAIHEISNRGVEVV